MLDRLKPVFGLKLDIVFDCHLLIINQVRNLFVDILPILFSGFKPRPQFSLFVLDTLLLKSELLLLCESVLVEVLVDQVQLFIKHHIKPFLSVINNTIELVLKIEHFVFIFENLV